MSDFEDYSEVIDYNNEKLVVYFKMKLKGTLYYICEDYRVFNVIDKNYVEVKDKKILKVINDMITLKKD